MCCPAKLTQPLTRLNVLRSVIAETNNAAKGSSPIRTDLQVLALLRKKAAQSRDASNQFADAKREDLKAKEDAQADVLNEYIGEVEVMPEEEVNQVVQDTIEKLKATTQNLKAGQVLQKLFGPGGMLDGKPVEKGPVAQMVARALK